MMGLDDFDIHGIAQYPGSGFQQLEAQVNAHAHVGREHDGDGAGRLHDTLLAGLVEAGGADHHAPAGTLAGFQVVERRLGAGEIHEHVVFKPGKAASDRDAKLADGRQLAGIGPGHARARAINGGGQAQAFRVRASLDQGAAHAPTRASDGNIDHDF